MATASPLHRPFVALAVAIVAKVEKTKLPGLIVDDDHRILYVNQAYRRAHPVSVVGRRCFEVSHGLTEPCDSHGEDCPLALSRESGDKVRVVHVHQTDDGPQHVEIVAEPMFDEQYGRWCVVQTVRALDCCVGASPGEGGLVGRSKAFNELIGLTQQVAPSEVDVLLVGESGTGKELVSRAIHCLSPRAKKAFVPLSCTGFAESVFESQLFGHEKGAFTGAYARRIGLVERAQGGTLFLDEIGDVSLAVQVKLLRLLEERRFRRVGGTELLEADFRLVCATNRDLDGEVQRGAFRLDLYHRINAFPIRLPPLRERISDIELLVDCCLDRIGSRKRLAPEALDALRAHPFPGNVRELFNTIQRGVLVAAGEVIRTGDLGLDAGRFDPSEPEPEPEPEPNSEPSKPLGPEFEEIVSLEKQAECYLRWCAEGFDGDRRELARQLGISERTLFRKLRAAGVTHDD